MPLVTVVIPCFNRADDLERAIRSVLRQTITDFEVIVADDASTEDLGAVVARARDERVTIVRRGVNGGIGAARNTAVAAASGRYLSFLDSDDEWYPDMLEMQLAALRSTPRPVAAVTTAYEMAYASGRREIRVPAPHHDFLRRVIRGADLSAGTTMMIEADAWREVGPWSEDIRRYEDYEWFLRFARSFDLRVVPSVCAVIHSNDRAPLDVDVSRRSVEGILELHSRWLAEIDPAYVRILRATFEQEIAWAAWRSGHRKPFVRHLARSLAFDPVGRSRLLASSAMARLKWRLRPGDVVVRRSWGSSA